MPNEPLNYESPRQDPPPDWSWIVHVLVAIVAGMSVFLGIAIAIMWAVGYW